MQQTTRETDVIIETCKHFEKMKNPHPHQSFFISKTVSLPQSYVNLRSRTIFACFCTIGLAYSTQALDSSTRRSQHR